MGSFRALGRRRRESPPYPSSTIGAWGIDSMEDDLYDPNTTLFEGQCTNHEDHKHEHWQRLLAFTRVTDARPAQPQPQPLQLYYKTGEIPFLRLIRTS